MAKKTIVYEAQLKNGHTTWVEKFVAPTKDHLKDALQTNDVKVENIRSLGQHNVEVIPDDDHRAATFRIKLQDNSELNISHGERGNNFLRSKFKNQTDKLEKELDEYNNPDWE